MKGLFCYDGPISKDKNNNYYGTVLNNKVFRRYFTIVDSLKVAIRVEEMENLNFKSSKITLDNIAFTDLPNLAQIKSVFIKKKVAKKLKKEIQNTDILFIRLPSFIGNLAVEIAKEMNKPYIIEMVGCPWDSLWNHSFKGKIIAPWMTLKTKYHLKNATDVVYVTNSFLQKRYPTKGNNVSCSNVELPITENIVLENRLEKINKSNNNLIIGTAAAVNVRYKGQQFIIEAISRLKELGIYIEYQLVGWGDNTYLKKKAKEFGIEDQVTFLGALNHDDIFVWLDSIDIYAQPSQQEGLPRALIEAMSRGCPSIGAATGGIPELIENEFIFSNTNDRITEICNILKDFNQQKMLEQAIRNFEESKFYEKKSIQKRRSTFFENFVNNNILK